MNEKKTEGLFLLRVKMLSRGSFSKYTNRMCFNKCTSNTFAFSHMILMMKFFIPPIYSLHFTLGTETFPHFFLNIQCVGPQRSCSDKKLIICYSHSYITHISSIFFVNVIEMCMFFSLIIFLENIPIHRSHTILQMIILIGVNEKQGCFTNRRSTGAFDDLSCKYFPSSIIS